jgi:hypothetical protein
MTVTTEEAERLAYRIEYLPSVAGAFCSLAAERDALRADLTAIVIPTVRYMDPPDGGDVSIAEQVSRMYRHVCDLEAERDKAQGYLSRCLQALYPNIEPLPDLLGVCTQIDNALTGQQAEITLMLEALEKLARLGAEPYYGNSEGNTIALAAMRKAKNRALAAEIRELIAAVERGAAQ